jgi:hypothetical protein
MNTVDTVVVDPERQAVRSELQSVLSELGEALLAYSHPALLLDAIRHAWILADLSALEDQTVHSLLHDLQNEIRHQPFFDGRWYAERVADLARSLSPAGIATDR